MNSTEIVSSFYILVLLIYFPGIDGGVSSCYYCNGNCNDSRVVTCTRPDSGCVSYKVKQNDHTEIFKNCFASSTWNCDRVKKWISNKHLHIKVIHCVTCMENDCNRNTYEAPLSSASINKIEYSFIMIPIFIPLLK